MDNHPTPQSPMSSGDLNRALLELGNLDDMRDRLVELLKELETRAEKGSGFDAREQVSGPILDAVFGHGRFVSKRLASGLTISARYTSKIIRDFVMSEDTEPDHVWEPQTTRTLLELTRTAKNVIIGGAYIGDHAILVADQLRTSGVVHCFELSPENLALLRINAEQNSLDNVNINAIALWSSAKRLKLVGTDSHAAPQEAESADADSFPATTIEDYFADQSISQLDLIMLDIEGGELEALKGASSLLSQPANVSPIIIFELHGAYTDWSRGLTHTDIVKFLAGHGYTMFAIRDYHSNVAMRGSPVELVELDTAYIEGPPHGFNILATKLPEELDSGIFRIVTEVSPKLLFHRDPAKHAPLSV